MLVLRSRLVPGVEQNLLAGRQAGYGASGDGPAGEGAGRVPEVHAGRVTLETVPGVVERDGVCVGRDVAAVKSFRAAP